MSTDNVSYPWSVVFRPFYYRNPILLEDRYAQAEGYRLFLAHQEMLEAVG